MFEGKPQIKYNENADSATIDIYSNNVQLEVTFGADKKKEAKTITYELNKKL